MDKTAETQENTFLLPGPDSNAIIEISRCASGQGGWHIAGTVRRGLAGRRRHAERRKDAEKDARL